MTKGNIIIVEGPQGVGKTSVANFLRENLTSTNLYRLTGIKDKTKTGYEKNKKMYFDLIEYMKSLEDYELNLVFDRTFFTEAVYSRLGYKEYLFDDVYDILVKKLSELNYNVYFVTLYLEDINLYEQRLKRNHHQYQTFSLENSVNQQNEYLKLFDDLNEKNINKLKIATDNFAVAYEKLINNIPVLKENNIKYNDV